MIVPTVEVAIKRRIIGHSIELLHIDSKQIVQDFMLFLDECPVLLLKELTL